MKIDRLIAMIMILMENEVMNAGALAKKLLIISIKTGMLPLEK